LHTFPIFALVGFEEKPVRPLAVEDSIRVLAASLTEGRLSKQTVAILGPEQLKLGDAVRRVAHVIGKRPLYFPAPIAFHLLLAVILERIMKVPLVSLAQVRILSEGIVEALPPCASLPEDLLPGTPFSEEQIRRGLPEAAHFGMKDLRCSA
jgi:hypothetical protein